VTVGTDAELACARWKGAHVVVVVQGLAGAFAAASNGANGVAADVVSRDPHRDQPLLGCIEIITVFIHDNDAGAERNLHGNHPLDGADSALVAAGCFGDGIVVRCAVRIDREGKMGREWGERFEQGLMQQQPVAVDLDGLKLQGVGMRYQGDKVRVDQWVSACELYPWIAHGARLIQGAFNLIAGQGFGAFRVGACITVQAAFVAAQGEFDKQQTEVVADQLLVGVAGGGGVFNASKGWGLA